MSIVISVRGACGAGKSTLVKSVMQDMGDLEFSWKGVRISGRRKPVGYELPDKKLFVPGHYEIQNGGLDTIGHLGDAHGWIFKYYKNDWNVLFEGMNQKNDDVWLESYGTALRVVFLDLSLEQCVKSFRAKGQKRDVKYVEATHRKAKREQEYFKARGHAPFVCCHREDALAVVKSLLEENQ